MRRFGPEHHDRPRDDWTDAERETAAVDIARTALDMGAIADPRLAAEWACAHVGADGGVLPPSDSASVTRPQAAETRVVGDER